MSRSCAFPCATPLARALSLAFGATVLFRAMPTFAACDNLAPRTGQTATCDTRAPNPSASPVVAAANSVNVRIDVTPQAVLNINGGPALVVRDNSKIDNRGTLAVNGTDADAIRAQSSGSGHDILVNEGAVSTTGTNAEGMVNVGAGAGARMGNARTGTIATSGTNASAMRDAGSAGGGTLVNEGTLGTTGAASFGMATQAHGDVLINTGSGRITTSGAGSHGLYASGAGTGAGNTLINNGTINVSGRGSNGIESLDASGDTITNTGKITASGVNGIGIHATGTTKIVNTTSGVIASQQGSGISAEAASTIDNAGTVNGAVSMNGFSTLTNSGTITGGVGATKGLNLDNSGSIEGAVGVAITGGNGNFTNSGTIRGTSASAIIANTSATIVNSGTLVGSDSAADMGTPSSHITNTGTMIGVNRAGASFENGGTLNNAGGTITGFTDGVFSQRSGTFSSSGAITGQTVAGIEMQGGGTFTILKGGTVTGPTGVVIGTLPATIVNGGTILGTDSLGRGIMTRSGANIENTGLIQGSLGIDIFSGTGNITNSGTINGTHGAAINLAQGGNVTNSGTLSGFQGITTTGAPVQITNSGNIPTGIDVSAGGSLNNSGTVSFLFLRDGVMNVVNSGMLGGVSVQIESSTPASLTLTNTGHIAPQSLFIAAISTDIGNDTVNMNAGSIDGAVSQGAGNDTFNMNGGVVTGAITQGSGDDSFTMNGGQIVSLDQGVGHNTFAMTAGLISGDVSGSDVARMSGGHVGGNVNLNAGNSTFTMSGGQVDGDVSALIGRDIFTMTGGTIAGRVLLGTGANGVYITGGSIGQGVTTSTGNDTFSWTGGTLAGAIVLGAGNDNAIVGHLTDSTLAAVTRIDGGVGNDTLTLDGTHMSGLSRLTGWESISTGDNTQLTFDARGLTLGDGVSGTGTFSTSGTTTLLAGGIGQTSISPYVAGQLVTFDNHATIDLTNGGASANDRFVVNGNYNGLGGARLQLQSVLGTDNSPSDRLVISRGAGTGKTVVSVTNVGGAGGMTRGDGIMVVQATNGAHTDLGSFTLGQPVSAGAYSYLLFKGGVSAGTGENWYLRSSTTLPAALSGVTPTGTGDPASTIGMARGRETNMALPVATAAAATDPVPLYREEVPVYSEIPALSRELTLQQIGTFHDRQGEQALLTESGALPAAWVRMWGGHATLHSEGAADPEFSGGIGGVQVGHDLYADGAPGGHRNHYGFFVGFARASGDVSGFALGVPNSDAGHLSMNAYTAGLYWTHIGPGGWYTDAVVLGSSLTVDPSSERGVGASTHGTALGASLEAGLPIALSSMFGIEPQAQLIWQHVTLNDFDDGISSVSLHEAGGLTGRLGVRLFGRFDAAGTSWEPYVRANLWRTFGATDTVTFAGSDVIPASVSATSAQFGAGIVAKVSARGSVYANVGYTMNVNGPNRSAIEGGAGVRWAW